MNTLAKVLAAAFAGLVILVALASLAAMSLAVWFVVQREWILAVLSGLAAGAALFVCVVLAAVMDARRFCRPEAPNLYRQPED